MELEDEIDAEENNLFSKIVKNFKRRIGKDEDIIFGAVIAGVIVLISLRE